MTGRGNLASWLALVLAGTVSLLLLVLPVYRSVSSSAALGSGSRSAAVGTKVSWTTLFDVNGPGVLVALAIPVASALMGVALQRAGRRHVRPLAPAIVLTFFCILTGFSIGLFYLPAAIALWVAAVLPARS